MQILVCIQNNLEKNCQHFRGISENFADVGASKSQCNVVNFHIYYNSLHTFEYDLH